MTELGDLCHHTLPRTALKAPASLVRQFLRMHTMALNEVDEPPRREKALLPVNSPLADEVDWVTKGAVTPMCAAAGRGRTRDHKGARSCAQTYARDSALPVLLLAARTRAAADHAGYAQKPLRASIHPLPTTDPPPRPFATIHPLPTPDPPPCPFTISSRRTLR